MKCMRAQYLEITVLTNSDSDWQKAITVRVGSPDYADSTKAATTKTKDYIVHESVIRRHSPFFDAAMSKDWKAAQERLVPLPKHKPSTFELYLGWIYSHQITISALAPNNSEVRVTELLIRG
jgi:hypothetical protein